jgi:hypothetical protein
MTELIYALRICAAPSKLAVMAFAIRPVQVPILPLHAARTAVCSFITGRSCWTVADGMQVVG